VFAIVLKLLTFSIWPNNILQNEHGVRYKFKFS